MIILRRADGNMIKVPADVKFVELVNDIDGHVMMVFFQSGPGAILKITPGTADAARYEQLFKGEGVKFQQTVLTHTNDPA